MKTLTLILFALAIGKSSSYLIKVPTAPSIQPKIAPVGWVHIQKLMLPLFENVCEDSTDPIVVRLAKEFTLESPDGDYTKTDIVSNYRTLKTGKGLLPKDMIFTEYNTEHMNEFRALFELFYYAKDFDTFYKSACWARQNVNCGLYVNALYLAVLKRRDTSKISVPAPYELLPNYFISKDIVIKASSLLAGGEITNEDVRVQGNAYILDVNYTSDFNNDDEDSKLVYFHEDVGLNSYYFLRKLRNAPWFNVPTDADNMYGEYMYLMMKQFAARYDLERYANGLAELDSFSWDSIINAYDPMLIYSNGKEFGHRTITGVLSESEDVVFLKTIENNLDSVVSHLRQTDHNKTQILNHLMEILVTSDKNYQKLTSQLLGSDDVSAERQHSVLEHYITSMRDPVFWRINKKIVELVDNALKVLPSYTRKELYFPGVEVLNIETKKMMTTFDEFQFDVTDSLRAVPNTTFQVKLAQPRLNHKPFTLKLNISSLVTQKGLVKIFIGPKTMPGELVLKKNLFVLLDRFELNLKRGSNIISRSSEEMKSFSGDFMSLRDLKKKIEDSEFGLDALPLKDVDSQVGYPSRLIIPKGLAEGLPVQLFVFVAPFYKTSINSPLSFGSRVLNSAIRSPGYPLDLRIDDRQLFNLPNALVKDIIITHKGDVKSTSYGSKAGPKRWDSDTTYNNNRFDYSSNNGQNNQLEAENIDYYVEDYYVDQIHRLTNDRPEFTYRKKDTTNYHAKRNEYKSEIDYSSQRGEKTKPGLNNEVADREVDTMNINNEKILDSPISVIPLNSKRDYDIISDQNVDKKKKTDKPKSDPEKIHGLLGDRPAFTHKNKGSTDYTAKRTQYKNKEDYASKRSQYKNKEFQNKITDNTKANDDTVIDNKNGLMPKNTINNTSNDYVDTSPIAVMPFGLNRNFDRIFDQNVEKNQESDILYKPEKIHGLLGDRPAFTYKNKDSKDYTAKRTQYKNKEDYAAKRSQYKNKEFKNKETDKTIIESTTQNIGQKNYTNKFIVIDNENDMVQKNIIDNTSNKDVYIDKTNNDKFETITKKVIKIPVIANTDRISEDTILTPVIGDTDESINLDNRDEERSDVTDLYEPEDFPDVPKRRISVYDYLFNFFDDDKVYE